MRQSYELHPRHRGRRLAGRTDCGTQDGRRCKGIHRNGFYRFQECHALTRERPTLLDQPRPDYRIGMVALQ